MELDKITFGLPSQDQLELINDRQNIYLDQAVKDLTAFTFPKNSSGATKSELNEIIKSLATLRENSQYMARYNYYDVNLFKFVRQEVGQITRDQPFVDMIVDGITTECLPLIFKLKYYFNRPRPRQLADYYKLKLFPRKSYTDDSPAYPSAHAYMIRLFAIAFTKKYPQFEQYFIDMVDDVCYSRLYMGLNYASDIDVGKFAAEKVASTNEFKFKFLV
jgi:hypothetical protein